MNIPSPAAVEIAVKHPSFLPGFLPYPVNVLGAGQQEVFGKAPVHAPAEASFFEEGELRSTELRSFEELLLGLRNLAEKHIRKVDRLQMLYGETTLEYGADELRLWDPCGEARVRYRPQTIKYRPFELTGEVGVAEFEAVRFGLRPYGIYSHFWSDRHSTLVSFLSISDTPPGPLLVVKGLERRLSPATKNSEEPPPYLVWTLLQISLWSLEV